MTATSTPDIPANTLGEEIASAVTHGVGTALSIAGLVVMIVLAALNGTVWSIVGVSIFGAALILLYLSSTLYHGISHRGAKRVLQVVDHGMIYLLIAGTYTPFTLGVLRGSWGWTLFGLAWGIAALGILLKALGLARHPAVSTSLYLALGWLVLIAIQPVMAHVPAAGLAWLLAGGLAYTLGVAFFLLDERLRYAHFVWHLFVVAGSACHVVAVMGYAA